MKKHEDSGRRRSNATQPAYTLPLLLLPPRALEGPNTLSSPHAGVQESALAARSSFTTLSSPHAGVQESALAAQSSFTTLSSSHTGVQE